MRARWPEAAPIDDGGEHWIGQWIDRGCGIDDVLAAIDALHDPPAGLHVLAAQVGVIQGNRLAA